MVRRDRKGAHLAAARGRASRSGTVLSWLRVPGNLLFALLIAAHLVPIWSFAHFPSQDGPTHLENAQILREYDHPDRTAFRDYYTLNTDLNPNWFGHLLLAALMYLFPPPAAEKLLLTIYVLLLPLSVRYALRSAHPEGGFLALLAFPFIYNYLLHMGFYNFVLSLPAFFYVVGRWLKDRGELTAKGTAALAAYSLLLYFCHLISLVLALIMIGMLAIGLAFLDALPALRERPARWGALLAAARARLLPGTIAFLPALLLAAVFVFRKGTASLPGPPAADLVRRLLFLDSLGSNNVREAIFATALAALFGLSALYLAVTKLARRRAEPLDLLLAVAVAFTIIYFIAPGRMSGGEFITHRLNLFPFFALILWFGGQRWDRAARWMVQALAAVISIGILGSQTLSYAAINAQLDEYLSGANFIERNTTLLPLCFSPFGRMADGRRASARISVFLHASGYIAAERRIVDFDNYEANTDYFPTAFRPGRNPDLHLALRKGTLETQPPCVDFLSYPEKTGGRVDYVLAWDLRDELLQHRCVQFISEQLREGYDLVHTSPGRGLMKLYRRKDFTSPGQSISR